MILEYIKERYQLSDFPAYSNWHDVLRAYAHSVKQEGYEIYETITGFAVYSVQGDALQLFDIYIKPEFRAKGHARHLSETLESKARKQGARVAITFTEKAGQKQELGIASAKACGYSLLAELKDEHLWIKGI